MRIAIAADTILYLPLYYLQAMRLADAEIELLTMHGDEEAYLALERAEAEFCVCDPMVVVKHARKKEPVGKAVASLVVRTGLWGVTTRHLSFNVGDKELDDVLSDERASIKSILTYTAASTGGRVVRHLIKERTLHTTSDGPQHLSCDFGTELNYLTQDYRDGDGREVKPEVIVTCDLTGAIASVAKKDAIYKGLPTESLPPVIALNLPTHPPYSEALFTVLVAQQEILKNNRPLVVSLVEAIRVALNRFYDNKDGKLTRDKISEILARKKDLFPSMESLQCTDDEYRNFCREAIEVLYEQKVLARSVRIESTRWEKAFDIWGLSQSDDPSDLRFFSKCCDLSIAREVEPPWLYRQLKVFRNVFQQSVFSILVLGAFQLFLVIGTIYSIWGSPNFLGNGWRRILLCTTFYVLLCFFLWFFKPSKK